MTVVEQGNESNLTLLGPAPGATIRCRPLWWDPSCPTRPADTASSRS